MKRNERKLGFTFYTKNLFQSFLWLIEAVGIPMLLMILLGVVAPQNLKAGVFEYIERYLACYGVYQVIVFIILKSISDCMKDQTLAIITTYEYTNLFLETGKDEVKDWVLHLCEAQQNSSKMNSFEIRREYETISEMLVNQDNDKLLFFMKQRLIYYKHEYERISLLWNYSILVRLFK